MSIYKKVKERASIHKMLSFYGIEKDNITNRYLCPFHKDNDFSLSVTPDDKHWQCMTCEAGGNVITLVEHMERLRGTRLGISDNYMERCNLIIDTQNLDIEKYYISPSMNENLLITNNRQYNQNNLWHSSQKDNNPIFVNGTELQLIYYYSSNIFCIEPCYNTYIAYKNINNLVRDKSAVYDTADSKFWLNLTREYLKETPATSVDVYLKTNSYALSIKFVVSNLISINIGSLCNMIKQEYGVNCLGVVNKEKELKYSVITLLIANKKLLPKPIVEKPLLSKITKRFGIDGKQNASKDECIYSIERGQMLRLPYLKMFESDFVFHFVNREPIIDTKKLLLLIANTFDFDVTCTQYLFSNFIRNEYGLGYSLRINPHYENDVTNAIKEWCYNTSVNKCYLSSESNFQKYLGLPADEDINIKLVNDILDYISCCVEYKRIDTFLNGVIIFKCLLHKRYSNTTNHNLLVTFKTFMRHYPLCLDVEQKLHILTVFKNIDNYSLNEQGDDTI